MNRIRPLSSSRDGAQGQLYSRPGNDIITRLGNASRVIMGEKAFQTFLLESGLEPESNSSPQELRRVLLSEVERWTPVIKGIGLQLE